MENRIW